MANHCFDVLCTICGAAWCIRGCGSHWQLNAEAVAKHLDFLKSTPCGVHYFHDMEHCGENKMVSF
jgi:hypothetical protein